MKDRLFTIMPIAPFVIIGMVLNMVATQAKHKPTASPQVHSNFEPLHPAEAAAAARHEAARASQIKDANDLIEKGSAAVGRAMLEQAASERPSTDAILPLAELYFRDHEYDRADALLRPLTKVAWPPEEMLLPAALAAVKIGKPHEGQDDYCVKRIKRVAGNLFDPDYLPKGETVRETSTLIVELALGIEDATYQGRYADGIAHLLEVTKQEPDNPLADYYLNYARSHFDGSQPLILAESKAALKRAKDPLKKELATRIFELRGIDPEWKQTHSGG
jgi:hypothetical protein